MAERGQTGGFQRSLDRDNLNESSASNQRMPEGSADQDDYTPERNQESTEKRTANRGFAAMDREKQKRIASEGGRAAHRQGVAHEWNKDEAREAGRKGGQIVSQNREHMSEIGRKGGQSSGQRRQRDESEG